MSLTLLCLAGLYLCCSVVLFVLYAVDKTAARKQRHRIAEFTLHCWSAAGGWPGALLAQQILRHKTRKFSFQVGYRISVAVNLAAVGWWLLRVAPG